MPRRRSPPQCSFALTSTGPLRWFPEAIHLVARADGKIARVADLRGKRVGLGLEGSGTRANALAILAVSGVAERALDAVHANALPESTRALADGRIDAFFATIHAPAQ